MLGWVLVAAVVSGYDAWTLLSKQENMSTVARRHPVLYVTGVALLTWHLWPTPLRRRYL